MTPEGALAARAQIIPEKKLETEPETKETVSTVSEEAVPDIDKPTHSTVESIEVLDEQPVEDSDGSIESSQESH